MKISVIIPSYKPQEYIFDCLLSIQKQTLNKLEFEVIIVLNGQEEPYKSILLQYIHTRLKDLTIQLHYTNLPGVSNARNTALKMAKGDFIAFVDDDDYLSKTYLEELLKVSDKKIIGISNVSAFYDKSGEELKNYRIKKVFKPYQTFSINGAKKYFSGPCMKLIHREIISNREFDKSFKLGEDSLFMFLISDRILACKSTSPEAVYHRRIRENSAYTRKKKFFEITKNQLKLIAQYLKIFFNNPSHYNRQFLLTRMGGAVKTWFVQVF